MGEDSDLEECKGGAPSGAIKVTNIGTRKYIRMPNFKKSAVNTMKSWLLDNIDHPYPTRKDKEALKRKTGLSKKQIQNWFTNARKVSLCFPNFAENLAAHDLIRLSLKSLEKNSIKL